MKVSTKLQLVLDKTQQHLHQGQNIDFGHETEFKFILQMIRQTDRQQILTGQTLTFNFGAAVKENDFKVQTSKLMIFLFCK